ncbi:ribosome biogenesis GTPase YlqF [Synechococcus sp. PCC 7336]|uniref:ribosome biogenesis GTPase YlqF n=1 Tax=Synechococcus sp. PCC 7336 TaxID=195250 RepID=UPI000349C664|nr:ribosome biogenesis GTPase YlqF [Synechococcus sp. PCC 7336]
MTTPAIQWYPGHIAKAQRQLQQQLQKVDAILEVLDARIPLASRHPDLDRWTRDKPRVLILNKADCISTAQLQSWQQWFERQGLTALPTNAREGKGISRVRQAAQQAGAAANERRRKRGMQPRPIRAAVIGFPNVGKSALLNRLMGKRVVESARRPGVTRQLRWVRLGQDLDLLDAPGILPPKLEDQQAALKLAICDDIGEAGYVSEHVAGALLDLLPQVDNRLEAVLCDRYGFEALDKPGSLLVHQFARDRHTGNVERAAKQILTDFRKGVLGAVALEQPPE